MDLLKLVGMAGGVAGSLAAIGLFFFIPDICEPEVTFLLTEYDCFGLGVYSREAWSLALGGATGGVVAIVTALMKKQD